jgi:hypothetical protein
VPIAAKLSQIRTQNTYNLGLSLEPLGSMLSVLQAKNRAQGSSRVNSRDQKCNRVVKNVINHFIQSKIGDYWCL